MIQGDDFTKLYITLHDLSYLKKKDLTLILT